ncbi:MAG: hypothetical protein QOE79_1332 [Sphingomonadales bacterium]|jgi:hypothetical protein|nr:hypothetical protein [Sphingomonadales bacterium]MEA3050555.1 hypothetical protein [Sphingomonadales bacterium]
MRLFVPALLSLAVPAALAAAPAQPRGADMLGHRQCAPPGAMFAKGRASRAGPHRLDEEPPAQAYLTVLRTFDYCPVPALLREEPSRGR